MHIKSKSVTFLLIFAVSLLLSCNLEAYLSSNETPIVKYLKPVVVTEFDSGIPPIDCIYVINLDHRTDKWAYIQSLFDSKGIHANRFGAVEGWLLSDEIKQEMAGPYPVKLYGGEIGCLISHISIIKDAYNRGFNLIWVCEDDLEFLEEDNLLTEFIDNLYKIDHKWDIFYTDTNCRNPGDGYYAPWQTNPRPDQILPSFDFFSIRTPLSNDIQRIRCRFGTTSMLITKRGMKKILDYFTHTYMWCPIDWDIHYIPGIREYAPTRDVITNLRNGFVSDIHSGG